MNRFGLTSAMHSPSTVVSLRSMEASGGVRDHKLLQSTLARPRQLYAYGAKVDMAALAAAYTFGIVRDGNKRTGFVLAVLFLEINDHNLVATEKAAAHAVLSLAAGAIDESAFAAWIRQNASRR